MAFGLLLAAGGHLAAGPLLFVSVSGENRIDAYTIDAATGALTRTSQTVLDGSPGPLVTDPAKKLLFAAYRPEGRLVSFNLDSKTGALTELSRTDVRIDAVHLSMDVGGQMLLSAYDSGGEVSVHKLGGDRRLPVLGTWTRTAPDAHSVVVHPRLNAMVFVAHPASDRIYQFKFNPGNGALTPSTNPYLLAPDHSGPRHLVFHPSMERCYVSNELGGSISHYRFEPKTGELVFVELFSTLPEGFLGANSASEIRIRPGGKHLYVANRGHDSIAAFTIDAMNGRLTPVGHFPTEANPRSFDVDPSGKFLYAAGEDSGRISAYKIDDATGELRRFAEYEAGTKPWWVMSVNAP